MYPKFIILTIIFSGSAYHLTKILVKQMQDSVFRINGKGNLKFILEAGCYINFLQCHETTRSICTLPEGDT